MFHANRWAAVFITVLGENAETGLDCLKAMSPPIKGISGAMFGYTSSRQLEKLLREGVTQTKFGAKFSTELEYVIRFITLLTEKNLFRHIDALLVKIEELIDAKNNVLIIDLVSATPLERALEEKLRQGIIERTGAVRIKMKTTVNPALMGGYRMRIGGLYIDASLKGQIESMKATLDTVGGGI